ncbi:hypothetical protein DBR06_SOUSAS31210005, partial [Sousa chinensis]
EYTSAKCKLPYLANGTEELITKQIQLHKTIHLLRNIKVSLPSLACNCISPDKVREGNDEFSYLKVLINNSLGTKKLRKINSMINNSFTQPIFTNVYFVSNIAKPEYRKHTRITATLLHAGTKKCLAVLEIHSLIKGELDGMLVQR